MIKIVLFGPESTGKTTLSKQLATHYNSPWVAEYARIFAEEKISKLQGNCTKGDVMKIAYGQLSLEEKALKKNPKMLICDTDILETKVYSKLYYNHVPNKLEELLKRNTCTLYLLTYIDTPWIEDGIRDKPNERPEIFKLFENTLIENRENYIILKGDEKQRFYIATKTIDKLLQHKNE